MAMSKADIHKTAFQAGSSGLYEFTQMPFGLCNVGASFCHLMEMCLGDQQYLTLLFYLDDICILGSSISEMLDRIELVFQHLKEFNLKINFEEVILLPVKCFILGPHIVQRWDFSKSQEDQEGEGLANTKDGKGSPFISRISVILSKVHTPVC